MLIFIILVKAVSFGPNVPAHRPGAHDIRIEIQMLSPGSVETAGSALKAWIA